MNAPKPLISGDELKASATRCATALKAKIEFEQNGYFSVFDKWFTQVLTSFMRFDPRKSWEQGVEDEIHRDPSQGKAMAWDLARLQLFLERWEQGRFVDYAQREAASVHYVPRYGTEFGTDVFLTSQGAPSIMQWRGIPLMKTVFDYALYPMILSELQPRTVFEIGTGLGASAIWIADHLALLGCNAQVHSVDLKPVPHNHEGVTFHRGDCSEPDRLFDPALLQEAPHPWLVIEDAHHNVEAVLDHFHQYMQAGDYLVVEDSEVKRDDLRSFNATHAGNYQVDTKFTDYFGRNATCAADSIFVRMA